jgi:hypothetical protein
VMRMAELETHFGSTIANHTDFRHDKTSKIEPK